MMHESRNIFRLSSSPLNPDEVHPILHDPACGAEVVFIGYMRSVSKGRKVLSLEFEAYEAMVVKELELIAEEIRRQWPIQTILLFHRTGLLKEGEIPVIAAVTSAHRKEAFEACTALMDLLKARVPIWKKEVFEDGSEWVSPTP